MRAAWRLLPIVLLVSWYAVQSQRYVPMFRSNVTLWGHAAEWAPVKPRVASNYAGSLLEARRGAEALRQYARARQLTTLPHVRPADARITRETVEATVTALVTAGLVAPP